MTMPKRAIAQTQARKLDSFPLKLPNCAASGKSRMTTAQAISQAHAVLGAPVGGADAVPGGVGCWADLCHGGVVAGRGEGGGLLVLHCCYSLGGVVCSSGAKAAGFTDLGRPSLFEKTP